MKKETRGGKREGAKRPTLYAFKTDTISIRVTGQDYKKASKGETYKEFYLKMKTEMQKKYQELLQGIA
jgi:hypothetical protein